MGGGIVRVLNSIAPDPSIHGDVRAGAVDPSGAAPTPSHAAHDAYASERAVSEFIAACRTQYGELSSQVN